MTNRVDNSTENKSKPVKEVNPLLVEVPENKSTTSSLTLFDFEGSNKVNKEWD